MGTKKIFVSSTVFDLIDIRAEVEEEIRKMNLLPVMSDSALDGFELKTDSSSIESCLANVRDSDYFVIILSKRYGPSLKDYGYDDLSATHLEYKEAVKNEIPILFYVRDKLSADHTVWKKNHSRPDMLLPWIDKKEFQIFQLLNEHAKLKGKKSNNWFQIFRNSVELRSILRKDLKIPFHQSILTSNIQNNRIPIFTAKIELSNKETGPFMKARIGFKNLGTTPAYNFVCYGQTGEKKGERPIVAPTDGYEFIVVPGDPRRDIAFYEEFKLEYLDSFGNKFEDVFIVKINGNPQGVITHSVKMKERNYSTGDDLPIKIISKG